MSLRTLGWLGCVLLVAMPMSAAAQSIEEEQTAAESDDAASGEPAEALGAPSDVATDPEPERSSTDPHEDPNRDYFFVGAFYRHVIIPSFIQQLFVDSTIDGSNPGTGLTFNWRRNNFNVVVDAWWNNANASGYFRGLGDPLTDTEYIQANLGVFFISAEFLWAFPITDWFAFELGFDLGIGFIYGGLTRTEAYQSGGQWHPCDGPGQNDVNYCQVNVAPDPCYDNSGEHYNCTEPNWTTKGGDVPVVFPWVSLPHIALRFNPIRQVQIRVDGGYGLYNFYFGGSVSYGWE